jgi:hypothetical protein
MKVLDEHVPAEQRQLLRSRLVPVRQIGRGLGRPGMPDEEIIPLLVRLRRPTFFTFDMAFYQSRFCSDQYCLVCIDTRDDEAASFVRRLLRHPRFNERPKRMGAVIRVSPSGIRVWRLLVEQESRIDWA